jgi:hypothetical protein
MQIIPDEKKPHLKRCGSLCVCPERVGTHG